MRTQLGQHLTPWSYLVSRFKAQAWPLLVVNMGVVMCFVLMTGWYRLHTYPGLLPQWYVIRFLLLWAALLTFGVWLVMRMPGMAALRRDRLRAGMIIALSLLAMWAYGSQTWAYTRFIRADVAASASLAWLAVALLALVITCAASPRAILLMVVICGLALSIIAMLQVEHQGALGLQWLGEQRFSADTGSILQAQDMTFVRPHGLLPHPNMLGGLLAVSVLCAAVLSVVGAGWRRAAGLVCCCLCLWGLLLTFSRAAWLGLAAGSLVAIVCMRIPRRALLALIGVAILVGGVFFISYRPLLEARAGASGEPIELRSISDRIVFTDFALRAIGEQPLVGLGVGAFPWRAASYISETFFDLQGDQVHNVFLAAWAELGIIGFGLLIAALALGIAAALRVIRQPPDATARADRAARVALLAAAIALGVIGLFDHYPYGQLPMMALWWGCLAAAGTRQIQVSSGRIAI